MYDLHEALGAYHVGIEVCGLEWSYGSADHGTGVFFVLPQTSSIGRFKETILLGETTMSIDEILEQLKRLAPDWKGSDYHILKKNCLRFSQAFVHILVPGADLPRWTTSTANNLRPLASLISVCKTLSIETFVTSVINERMWKEARVRMLEYQKIPRKTARSSSTAGIPKIIHSVTHGIPDEHGIDETISILHRSHTFVANKYSRYAQSLLRLRSFV